jgi:hypothetical protein
MGEKIGALPEQKRTQMSEGIGRGPHWLILPKRRFSSSKFPGGQPLLADNQFTAEPERKLAPHWRSAFFEIGDLASQYTNPLCDGFLTQPQSQPRLL